MKKQNIIIILGLSIFILMIKGCGVMSNPRETLENDDSLESSISNISDLSRIQINYYIIQIPNNPKNSEFISLLGDEYKIFDNNNSFLLFLNFMQEQKNIFLQDDKIQIEQLILNLKSRPINFQEKNLLFYTFNTDNSYFLNENLDDNRSDEIFSIRLNQEERDESFYNILFYPIEKDISAIKVEGNLEEITVLKDINTV